MINISVIHDDITTLNVDAVVNAANASLAGGGGVDGAIHRAGGPTILEECRKIGSCPTGHAVITSAGKLPAKFIIHAVGPIWKDGKQNEAALLRSAYDNSLKLAFGIRLKSIAFPNISTGIYGFPKREAAGIAIESVRQFPGYKTLNLEVIFVCFDHENFRIYQEILGRL